MPRVPTIRPSLVEPDLKGFPGSRPKPSLYRRAEIATRQDWRNANPDPGEAKAVLGALSRFVKVACVVGPEG
jgi:hypothetical protein